jgi:nitrogen fixation NifU-like protein
MNDADLDDLYQQVILDHGKNPRNFRVLDDANRAAEGLNPLCGDHFKLFVRVDDGGVIRDVAFQGQGCAISRASASLMTQAVKGKPVGDAVALFEKVHRLVTDGPSTVNPEELGKLAVLSGVCQFPTRVKCASLAWHTLKSALEGGATVSTE